MSFLPAPQPTKPHNVAMHVKVTDYSVYPTVSAADRRRQQQEVFESLEGKLNSAVLDKHRAGAVRTMTEGEVSGFVRCNGNIIAPPSIPYKPWAPKQYQTREHWQPSLDVFLEEDRRKAAEADRAMRSKNYFDNFTKQPPKRDCKAMIPPPFVAPESVPDITGFRGLGHYSPEVVHSKQFAPEHHTAKLPPWCQEGLYDFHKSSERRQNPSYFSTNVASLLGQGGPRPMHGGGGDGGSDEAYGSSNGCTPSRYGVEKGAAFHKEVSHKRLYHVPDSTGGHPSPVGAKMPSRDHTTNGEYYNAARYDALSQGRAHTSMLP